MIQNEETRSPGMPLLRARRDRPGKVRAPEKGDELMPRHATPPIYSDTTRVSDLTRITEAIAASQSADTRGVGWSWVCGNADVLRRHRMVLSSVRCSFLLARGSPVGAHRCSRRNLKTPRFLPDGPTPWRAFALGNDLPPVYRRRGNFRCAASAVVMVGSVRADRDGASR
jgi:hypothetical protein